MNDDPKTTDEPAYAIEIREGVRNILAAGLPKATSPLHIEILMDKVFAFAEGVIGDLHDRYPADTPIACAAGCSFCCHNYEVHISPLEAFRLAAHIRSGVGRDIREDVLERATTIAGVKDKEEAEADGLPRRRLFPCPVLDRETGLCRAYDARPLVCRGHNSIDRPACEQRFDNDLENSAMIYGSLHQRAGAQAVLSGVRLALTDAGAPDRVLDLARSLALLLAGDDEIEEAIEDMSRLDPAIARTTA